MCFGSEARRWTGFGNRRGVRDFIRQEVREVLLAAGIILPDPAPKPKQPGSHLRLIDK
jgi:hypothetical protein